MYEEQIYENQKSKITMMADTIKSGLVTLMFEGKGTDYKRFLGGIAAEDMEYVRLLSMDGRIIGSSNPSEVGSVSREAETAGWKSGTGVFMKGKDGQSSYSTIVPIYNERPCQRCHREEGEVIGLLSVKASMKSTEDRLRGLRRSTYMVYGVSILALSASIWALTTILVNRPIRSIMESTNRVKEGELDVRFGTGRKDEIGDLAESLNSMLYELNRARQEVEICHFEAMKRVEKMATIGELAAAIAHEIKNPLAGISGAIQVLAEDFSHEDPRRDIINEVLNEIERLDKAVKDLLSFARPPELHPIKTLMEPIVERVKRLATMQAERYGVALNFVSKGSAVEVSVDPEQMQQVFLNIILNALHSMPGGGALNITTTYMPEGGTVEIAFSDTGHGISPDDIKNIFKPFFTTKQAGTGLGLAISKNIVEKHGGSMTVESRPGIGSTFTVTLPGGTEKNV
jgi:signal transduction histidine kinase